ncbi:hypothetical protein M7I_1479 [Glarea lozoyensis 74030]|uniref:N-acetyltransferase domain-containing protein n=1 Tax=Glarea lozoyensis (strain ATCC 74030 / MF5533) TaxID=1104152 RepID=H0EG69_GLAL7|nr:hypothetical protein M7I_1479 [Glarea lozoyensis 74030]
MAPPPEYTLSPAYLSDIPAMLPVYHSAFTDDPLSSYTFPRSRIAPEEFTRWLTTRFTMLFHRPETRYFKVEKDGELVALARWSFPYRLSEEEKAKRASDKEEKKKRDEREGRDTDWPVGANDECCREKFGGIGRAFERFVEDREDVYVLGLIGVSQEHRRKGLATMLINHVLDMADQEGKQTYLDATDEGWFVYSKLGFEVKGTVEIDLTKYGGEGKARNRNMIRQPKKIE